MALSPRLEVRQSQSLTLTPQLMQSIRLLQLSHLELDLFVDAELLRNPLLERDEAAADPADPIDPPAEPAADEDTVDHAERIQDADTIAGAYDTEIDNVFPEQRGEDRLAGEWTGSGSDGTDAPDIDQYIAARPTLAEHLGVQIGLLLTDPADRLIARFLA
ncbi:MAG TPA: RNA polymerase sigma-54 factor, partial [Devosia sp.]|nr:RNA polymerase sigma-54 factor [Devosia sp.]